MEEKDKKKILIGSIIIVITLILVVIGTTYAFFALEIKGSETSTSIHLTAGNTNQIVLDGGIEGFHINVNASDMAYNNKGTEYFATDGEGNYVKTKGEGTKTIGTITINGNLEEKHKCTASVNIVTSGTMKSYLQKGDLILVLIQGEKEQEIDLTEIGNPTIEFDLQGTASQTIKAYLKLTNRDAEQKDIAGKTLNVTINIQDLRCEVDNSKPALEMLREHAIGGEETVTFTEVDVDGMYRYKGTATEVTNNYICFGTNSTEVCTDNPDEFMYRIIGITNKEDSTINLPANSLKLIKATPSSESEKWNSLTYSRDCETDGEENGKCKWDASGMKKYLIETFLPDAISKWDNGTTWDTIILSHSWYNADYKNVPNTEPMTSYTEESKIGLMYATDYKNSGDQNENNWLYIQNGWSTNRSKFRTEWSMSRWGYNNSDESYDAYMIKGVGGTLSWGLLFETYAVRAVFYVDPNITLTGEGNTENPFIIHTT